MDFPAGLPVLKQQGYAYQLDLGLIHSKIKTGNTQIRKATARPTIINASLTLNQSQLSVFESFVMASGHNWFSAKVMTGDGVSVQSVRLADNFNHAMNNGLHDISMMLELQSHSNGIVSEGMSQEQREVFYWLGESVLADIALIDPDQPLYGLP